jgi:hypothetical protein
MSKRKNEAKHDQVVVDTFPASDPPTSSSITVPRIASHDRPGRTAPHKREEGSRPKGTSTDDRHRAKVAYQWQHEERSSRL